MSQLVYEPSDKVRAWRRPVQAAVEAFSRMDLGSHGYIPFLLWLGLFFGGIWFPATSYLKYYFENGTRPETVLMPVMEIRGVGSFLYNLVCLGACLMFWSWTNLALLCVMSSTMGEINRVRTNGEKAGVPGQGSQLHTEYRPEYRLACTRAFVVYLIALVNGITFGGSLVSTGQAADVQGTYIRVAVMACIASFLASYRPEFFDGLLHRFAATSEKPASRTETEAVTVIHQSKTESVRLPPESMPDDQAARLLSSQFQQRSSKPSGPAPVRTSVSGNAPAAGSSPTPAK